MVLSKVSHISTWCFFSKNCAILTANEALETLRMWDTTSFKIAISYSNSITKGSTCQSTILKHQNFYFLDVVLVEGRWWSSRARCILNAFSARFELVRIPLINVFYTITWSTKGLTRIFVPQIKCEASSLLNDFVLINPLANIIDARQSYNPRKKCTCLPNSQEL